MERNYIIAGANSSIARSIIHKINDDQINIFCLSRGDLELNKNNLYQLRINVVEDDLPENFLPETIHGAIYMPGTINLKPFKRFKYQDFQKDWSINVGGATRFFQWVLPRMSHKSAALMFSSLAVQTGMPFHASVAMAKGAIEGLTRSLAAEYAPKIRFNALALSLTHSKMSDRFVNTDEKLERSRDRHPVQEIGNPDDIAELATFLLSEKASFITGQNIAVDGGRTGCL